MGAEFIQVYPQGGLGTPCNLPLKPRPPKTHSFHLTKGGSRQLGRQACRGAGGVGGRGDVDCGFAWVCVPAQGPCS